MIDTSVFLATECESKLADCFPQNVQQKFVTITLEMIRESAEYFKGYKNPSRETRANHRRGFMENALQELGASFPAISISIENYGGDSGSYTMLESKGMRITESKTERRDAPPRQANFRDDILSSSQTNFFEEIIPQNGNLYGILVYRVNKNNIVPDYIGIGFPNFRNSGWAHYIDLLERFGENLSAHADDPIINSEVSLDIKLKR